MLYFACSLASMASFGLWCTWRCSSGSCSRIFIILSGERASVLRAKLVQRCYLFAVFKNHSRPRCKPSCIVENKQVSCDSTALVGRAPESSPWFVRRRGVIIDVPEGAVAGSRAIVSLPDDGSARHATVTIAFPPGLSTGQELTVALEV